MKNKELIKKLSKYPQDALVQVSSLNSVFGYDDIISLSDGRVTKTHVTKKGKERILHNGTVIFLEYR
jgi:hypothetical protein